MNASQNNIPSGIVLAAVGLLLPYIPNITTDNLQRALETIKNPDTAVEKDPRPQKPYTRKGAAEMLGVSIPTIDRYLASGHLTRVRYSARAIRISAESVHNLMVCGAELKHDSENNCNNEITH
jgi:excisionase family DNA binding protein